MNTKELMSIALELAGLDYLPSDSSINVEGKNIKKILIGVDMETPELLLARELGCDCVVSHHPKADTSRTEFTKVMESQIDKMVEFGVPINKAQKALKPRLETVGLGTHVSNFDRVSSAARLLNMPYMNIHQPADIIGQRFVQVYLDERFVDNPKKTLKDVIDALNEIDVYKKTLPGTRPVIRIGSEDDFAGKIAVLMAGGTGGGKDVLKAYFEAGVGTIVSMHCPEDDIKAIKEQNIGNLVVAGHMSSDSIGLNRIIEEWEKHGVEVIKMSGIL